MPATMNCVRARAAPSLRLSRSAAPSLRLQHPGAAAGRRSGTARLAAAAAAAAGAPLPGSSGGGHKQQRAPAAAASAIATDTQTATSTEQQQRPQFDWFKAWWPVAVLDQLDASVPTPSQLLGQDLVLWYDRHAQRWRAFQDVCPHRLARLSEGRVDDRSGNLFCNYHGWQFDGAGACTSIPQLPAGTAPNQQRSCVSAFPTTEAEGLLWVWGSSGKGAEAEAAATPLAALAPEVAQFGAAGFWSTKLFGSRNLDLGRWYQRYCNATYASVKENVFNDPSHDTVLHHGVGGLSRDAAGPGEVKDFSADDHGYSISRLNPSGRVVTETCVYPCAIRRDFAGDARFGGGVGYVTPTSRGRCNMIIGVVRQPDCAPKPAGVLGRLVEALSPPTPEWLKHLALHDVVDADVAMQHGLGVNASRHASPGYMPAIGMDRGPVAFRRWLNKTAGGGPPTDREYLATPAEPLPREVLLDRYHTHTVHCKSCSAALAVFRTLTAVADRAAAVLAAAALGLAALAALQAQQAAAAVAAASVAAAPGASLLLPTAGLLSVAAAAVWALAGWASRYAQRFVFVDYDHHCASKV